MIAASPSPQQSSWFDVVWPVVSEPAPPVSPMPTTEQGPSTELIGLRLLSLSNHCIAHPGPSSSSSSFRGGFIVRRRILTQRESDYSSWPGARGLREVATHCAAIEQFEYYV
jgi:hypothetical protein